MIHAKQRICRSAIAFTLFCGAVSAQTITNTGVNQDLGPGWRTPTVAKLDVDGNNVLGTDGYYIPKSNNQPVQTLVPAYITGYTLAPGTGIYSSAITANGCTYALIDDPLATPGAPICTGNINRSPGTGVQVPLLSFTLTGTVPGKIRLAIMVDNVDLTGFNSIGVQVNGTSVGPAIVTGPAATAPLFNNKVPDWIYFDIDGGAPGQVVTILATGGARGTADIGGLALDSLPQAIDGYQVRYFSNLAIGESVINFTNSGASSTTAFDANFAQNGQICANVYAYSPDEQLVSCCSCNVTPNALNSLSVKADLGTNTLTPIIPSALVVKVIATAGGAACNASTAATVSANTQRVPGMLAWGSTIHQLPVAGGTIAGTYGVTETPFSKATMTTAELQRMTQLCAFIRANGSGYGICKSCKVGGLGASSK